MMMIKCYGDVVRSRSTSANAGAGQRQAPFCPVNNRLLRKLKALKIDFYKIILYN